MDNNKVVTTQRTAKKLKALKVLSFMVGMLGFMIAVTNSDNQAVALVGMVMVMIGTALYIWARVKIWWDHS